MIPSAILAYTNLLYAALCVYIVLTDPPPSPDRDPTDNFERCNTLCACLFSSAGCITLAMVILRLYRPLSDWHTTLPLTIAAILNVTTAYLLSGRYAGTGRVGPGCDQKGRYGWSQTVEADAQAMLEQGHK